MTISISPSRAAASSCAALSGAARNFARRCTTATRAMSLQRQRPVHRRIAAAGDHHALAAQVLAPAHIVLHGAGRLVPRKPVQRRTIGTERAGAGGDQHRLGAHRVALVGGQRETRPAHRRDPSRAARAGAAHGTARSGVRAAPPARRRRSPDAPGCRRSASPDRAPRIGRPPPPAHRSARWRASACPARTPRTGRPGRRR